MKLVRCFTIIPLLALAATGCDRRGSTRVVDPPPEAGPVVVEAHWVTDKEALGSAVRLAAASPLVRRAFVTSPHPRLTPMHRFAVRAVGTVDDGSADGSAVGVTMLPYMVDDDSTHAAFISLIDGESAQVAEFSELIFGREPTSLETGFREVRIENRIAWVKSGEAILAAADGSIHPSPQRRNWLKFAECFFDRGPGYCKAGSDMAQIVAPGVPQARAVGCAVGTAVAGISCAAEHLR